MSDKDPKDTDSVTDTREDVVPAGLIVGQAISDVLDVTRATSAINELKNQATSENLDDNKSTNAADDVSDIVLENMQATVDSDENQLASAADELDYVGNCLQLAASLPEILAEEVGIPQASNEPYSLGIDLQLAGARPETSAE
jgi:exopolyphosphatase/pppGpp-phosphohydrolase